MKEDAYHYLIDKLDQFIRKFYFNKLLKGVLYSSAIIVVYFLIIILAENQFYFSTLLRKILFYSFLLSSLLIIAFYIIKPLFNLYNIGKVINHKQAADIIGTYFKDVEDKLLNILQLKDVAVTLSDASLINASINQKANEIKPVPFTQAVNLNENKRYLKYALPPLVLLLILFFWNPSLVKNSTERLINNNTTYAKPAPFSFHLLNKNLQATQFDDFKIDLNLKGNTLPDNVYLIKDGIKHSLQKLNTSNFSYIFTNLQDDIRFHFEASGFVSDEYVLSVNEKSVIKNFQVKVDYPDYLGLQNKVMVNEGDLSVPEGSKLRWIFDAQATNKISMRFSDTLISVKNTGNNTFIFDKKLINSEKYIVSIFNNNQFKIDSSAFNILVEKDNYPKIELQEYQDSTNNDVYFYIGKIIDDYGLKKLVLNYSIYKNGILNKKKIVSIPFTKGTVSDFSHYWNIKDLGVEPGDKIVYYFQVYDNDAINGSKSSKSKRMTINLSSIEKLAEQSDNQFDEIKYDLQQSISESKEIQRELKNLQNDLLKKRDLTWEDKKSLEDILSRQEELQNKLEKTKDNYHENIEKQSDFKEVPPEIKEKQEMIEKLFDKVIDEETKALIDKLQQLMEEMDKDDALQKIDEMEVNNDDVEDELDRMLALLEKLENEQKLRESIDKLNDLSKKQQDLSDKTKNDELDKDELKDKQEKLNTEFDKLKNKIEELNKNSEKLNLDKEEELADDIQELQDESNEQLDNGNNKKASEQQKNASEKMKEMAQGMQNMMNSMQMASVTEDMESIRQLLENLVILSHEQEYLLDQFLQTTINTPKYVSLTQRQFKLIDDAELVEDSLYALAKRVFEIEAFITEEIKDINSNLNKSVNYLENRKISNASVRQQYVMTGFNNLALMLSEVLDNMQKQMAEQIQGNQMCENPGSNSGVKPGKIPSLKQMQQQLSDQISEMGEMSKQSKQSGNKPLNSGNGQSEKLSKMAAKQQAIRQKLEEINQSDNKDGKGSLGNLQKLIDEMKENEEDIVNKRITNELIIRQKDIMTRLLQAENAERERDEKEERESITAHDYKKTPPPSLKEFLEKKMGSIELYRHIPPKLKPFYKNISEKYFKNVSNIH